jgi:hypothetical protein
MRMIVLQVSTAIGLVGAACSRTPPAAIAQNDPAHSDAGMVADGGLGAFLDADASVIADHDAGAIADGDAGVIATADAGSLTDAGVLETVHDSATDPSGLTIDGFTWENPLPWGVGSSAA